METPKISESFKNIENEADKALTEFTDEVFSSYVEQPTRPDEIKSKLSKLLSVSFVHQFAHILQTNTLRDVLDSLGYVRKEEHDPEETEDHSGDILVRVVFGEQEWGFIYEFCTLKDSPKGCFSLTKGYRDAKRFKTTQEAKDFIDKYTKNETDGRSYGKVIEIITPDESYPYVPKVRRMRSLKTK